MPRRFKIMLSGVDYRRVRPHHLHAAMCAALGEHDLQAKSWSVAMLAGDGHIARLEVRTLTLDADSAIPEIFAVGRPLVLNRQQALVVQAPEVTAAATWDQLSTPSSLARRSISFDTPTTFRNGSRFSPFPEPRTILRSLVARWNAFAGEYRQIRRIAAAELEPLWISEIEGRTVVLKIPHATAPAKTSELTVPGFVGRITVRCTDPDLARLWNCLIHFAEYAGIGTYTAHGLGTIHLLPH